MLQSGVITFLEDKANHDVDAAKYSTEHEKWIENIQSHMLKKHKKDLSFGRTAKLVAVFVKSYFILGNHDDTKLAHVAYPPIDSILLEGIDDYLKKDLSARFKWQELGKTQYDILISELKIIVGNDPFWTIEKYWVPYDS